MIVFGRRPGFFSNTNGSSARKSAPETQKQSEIQRRKRKGMAREMWARDPEKEKENDEEKERQRGDIKERRHSCRRATAATGARWPAETTHRRIMRRKFFT